MSKKLTFSQQWNGKPSSSVTTNPYSIKFMVSATTGDLMIEIEAPFFDDPPPPVEPGKYEKTYEYEVVEIFLASYPDDDNAGPYNPYLEIQIGPHGHHMCVFFLEEGNFATQDTSIELESQPITRIDRSKGTWKAEMNIASFFLPEPACGDDLSITWMMNAYAIHGIGSKREYHAYSAIEEGDSPNFHKLGYFEPLMLFETMESRMTIDRSTSFAQEKMRQSMSKEDGTAPSNAAAAVATGGGADLTSRLLADVEKAAHAQESAADTTGLARLTEADEDAVSSDDEVDTPAKKSIFGFANNSSSSSTGGGPAGKGPVPTPAAVGTAGAAAGESTLKRSDASNTFGSGEGSDLLDAVTAEILEMKMFLPILEEKFTRHLEYSVERLNVQRKGKAEFTEFSVLHGYVTKRKGLSIKSRMLILTNKARLLYFNPKGTFKGSMPWTLTKPVHVTRVSNTKFQITVHDKSRTYHITDNQGSDRWITCIELYTKAQRNYLVHTLAPPSA
mmetsp:Transcript_21480/g.35969  ORF Transcript_21480/g.35969 Transcript_21480/m.35969 type:complete len:503 (-) Transcript_21480:200-1708(-)